MKKSRVFLITTVLLAQVLLAASCATTTVSDFCSSGLSGLNERIDNALLVLRSWEPDRSLASVDEHTRHRLSIDLSLDDRRSWSHWAMDRLKEIQVYGDAAEMDPKFRAVRSDFMTMANEWVSFDGYASLSQVDRMIVMLDHLRRESDEVAAKVCPTKKVLRTFW